MICLYAPLIDAVMNTYGVTWYDPCMTNVTCYAAYKLMN